jgi:hypothetical protein
MFFRSSPFPWESQGNRREQIHSSWDIYMAAPTPHEDKLKCGENLQDNRMEIAYLVGEDDVIQYEGFWDYNRKPVESPTKKHKRVICETIEKLKDLVGLQSEGREGISRRQIRAVSVGLLLHSKDYDNAYWSSSLPSVFYVNDREKFNEDLITIWKSMYVGKEYKPENVVSWFSKFTHHRYVPKKESTPICFTSTDSNHFTKVLPITQLHCATVPLRLKKRKADWATRFSKGIQVQRLN